MDMEVAQALFYPKYYHCLSPTSAATMPSKASKFLKKLKKPFKKGGYKKRSFDGDGFLEGEGGGPKKKGAYKKPFKKKGGFKKGGKKGGYGSGFDDSFSGRSGGRRTKPGSKRH